MVIPAALPFRRAATLLLSAALATPGAPAAAAPPKPLEAECHVRIHGSHATADCYNGNAQPDRVQLHLRCVHWWDPAMDTAPVTVGPAARAHLAQRCWFRIREARVSHAPG
ncbi:hypothetical protein [Streptomyces orinoci]|uniref:Secreted protein n=1 Tax=Streptomyces orinoci TaxID=67339 RepID=A0ABV3JWR6_STRON|nr:hypothetical protein [Streptomyces orinoci]